MISLVGRWLCPTPIPDPVDWIFDPDGDDDEESLQGFNDPVSWEPGDQEEEDEE